MDSTFNPAPTVLDLGVPDFVVLGLGVVQGSMADLPSKSRVSGPIWGWTYGRSQKVGIGLCASPTA